MQIHLELAKLLLALIQFGLQSVVAVFQSVQLLQREAVQQQKRKSMKRSSQQDFFHQSQNAVL
jgi:hypothetical protein